MADENVMLSRMMKTIGKLIISVITIIGIIWNISTVFAEELIIVGTGSGTAILKAIANAFQEQHSDTAVTIPESIGSKGGIRAVGRDEYVLGRVSREIKEKEKEYGLTYRPYAKIPIVFCVNSTVNIETLSPQQIADIYSGQITNWKELGGDDAKIRVITRQEGSSSFNILLGTLPGFSDITITSRAKTTHSVPETQDSIERVSGAIGYLSYGVAQNADVHILKIDGKSANELDYSYVGTLGLVYKEANYIDNVKTFVEFALSESATEAITSAGGIPLK